MQTHQVHQELVTLGDFFDVALPGVYCCNVVKLVVKFDVVTLNHGENKDRLICKSLVTMLKVHIKRFSAIQTVKSVLLIQQFVCYLNNKNEP